MTEAEDRKDEQQTIAETQRHFKQIKVSIDENLAYTFKEACRASGISMAEILAQFMVRYTNSQSRKKRTPDYATKRQRRNALLTVVDTLRQLKEHEEIYRDRIPENLQSSVHYENAEAFIALLEEAIDLLTQVP